MFYRSPALLSLVESLALERDMSKHLNGLLRKRGLWPRKINGAVILKQWRVSHSLKKKNI
jgi:hypothetical protein